MRKAVGVAALVLAVSAALAARARAAPRRALWAVVRTCDLKERLTGSPWPCLEVDRRKGVVVVPDPKRRPHLLLSPLRRIPGLESPELLAAGGPNYWWEAWGARDLLARRAGRPLGPEQVGLAVNSVSGRTQDQLHIHIACLRPSVRSALDAQLGDVGTDWSELRRPLRRDHRYRARWLGEAALRAENPFRLLADDPATAPDLGGWTMALVFARRATGEAGFVLLSHRADPDRWDLGAAEELLDVRCRGAAPAASSPGRP